MSTPIDPTDEKNIRAYVKEFEDNGNSTRVHQLRVLLDEIDHLRSVIDDLKLEKAGLA